MAFVVEPIANPVPPYLNPGEIAKACGISRKRCFTELRHAQLIERRGFWRISSSALRERLPDFYERVYEYFARRMGTM
jgi:hypothetical protein